MVVYLYDYVLNDCLQLDCKVREGRNCSTPHRMTHAYKAQFIESINEDLSEVLVGLEAIVF